MKCPRCATEMGSLDTCPYCHYRVPLNHGFSYQETQPPQEDPQRKQRKGPSNAAIMRRLAKIEMRVNLAIVLLLGNFALVLLALIVLMVK